MHPKRKTMSVTLVLLCVLTMAVGTVSASEQTPSVKFNAKAKGSGVVIWGIVGIPNGEELTYGAYEAHWTLAKSKFELHGKSPATYEVVSSEERWWFSDARGNGKLYAQWDGHDLKIKIEVEETAGAHLKRGAFGSLIVGVDLDAPDLPSLFDPQRATMSFEGEYDDDKISGTINGFLTIEFFIVNLWIANLETYVGFYWSKTAIDIPIFEGEVLIAIVHVPAVKKLKSKVKSK